MSDEDKIADQLGVPREEAHDGVPTAEAVDRARMELPDDVRNERGLRPLLGPGGVVGWERVEAGVMHRYDRGGQHHRVVGERPLDPTPSPLDLGGPALLRAGSGVRALLFSRLPAVSRLRLTEPSLAGRAGAAGGAQGAFSRILGFTERNLQKGFTKHGADFGMTGNWNPSRAADFSRAVNQHINAPGIRSITGTYRGNPVTHYVDPSTGLNVIADQAGNYVSGWRLGAEQLESLLTTGRLF